MEAQHLTNKRIINFLNKGHTLLLDGGLSNQLEEQGFDLNSALWSADLLMKQPHAIIEAHKHYLNAGAQCLITASYQATVAGFKSIGLSDEQAKALIISSVQLAKRAVDEFVEDNPSTEKPFIAASIGPYGASLADGSEYHGDYNVSDEVLKAHHQAQIALLATTTADLFACETIPSLQEARVLKALLEKEMKPAWLSFSCKNGKQLNDGIRIEDCVKEFSHTNTPFALGINCTNPKYIVELIERIKNTCPDKFIVVYPNSGENYDPQYKTWHGTSTPNECGQAAKDWLQAGAHILGGCCRMGPKHIASIKRTLNL